MDELATKQEIYRRNPGAVAVRDIEKLEVAVQGRQSTIDGATAAKQTVEAQISTLLPAQKASEIMVGLPSQKQVEVVKRIANMEQTNPEVIKEVERGLEHRLSDIVSQTFEKAGGVDTVAEILNLADRSTEKGIMEGLEAEDPDLVEQIRRLMFVFEDILLVNDKGIQSVLKEIDNEVLSLALKTASQ